MVAKHGFLNFSFAIGADGRQTVVGNGRAAVGRPSDGPTAVPGRPTSRFFPWGCLGGLQYMGVKPPPGFFKTKLLVTYVDSTRFV